MAAVMKITAFWDVTPCSLVEVYRLFGGTCYVHLQGIIFLYPEDGGSMFL
jgi:hypothetical protein